MINLTLNEIVGAVKGQIIKIGRDTEIQSVSTDTRSIGRDSIFIALKGENFNGNRFSPEASKNGAVVCIIDELLCSEDEFNQDTTIIKVNDGKQALMELAKYYRSKLNIKVVGITGSTGKTSTKDLIAAVLGAKFKVFKTKGNFNNEIGLPLMIFKLDDSYEVAVLEMGMSNLGEIHRLADIARPDVGVITNIGVSHIEFLKTRENILKAKLEITDFFHSTNQLIVNKDNDLLSNLKSDKYNVLKVSSEGMADYYAREMILGEDSIRFKVAEIDGVQSNEFKVNVPGKHNVNNSLLAIACGRALGIEYSEMIEGIKNLEVTSMRLDIVRGKIFTIIDDCYNASPDSMRAALDVLSHAKGNKKIAILGTMKELGEDAWDFHKQIGEYARFKNIDELIAIGEYSGAFREGFGIQTKVFDDNEKVFAYLQKILKPGDVALVKASRSMKFESIVNKLKMINC